METPHYPTTDRTSKLSRFLDRYRFLIAGILLLAIAITMMVMMRPKTSATAPAGKAYDTYEDAGTIENVEAATASQTTTQLAVDIAGAVRAPGVYYLTAGSIVNSAIEAAGGLAPNADIDFVYEKINRAALLEDHSKVFIPRLGQSMVASTLPASVSAPAYIAPTQNSTSQSPGTINTDNTININTDTAARLEELPGVGPVLAQRIVDFRTLNGPFAKIEDIKNVPGIGESLYSKMKDQITV